MKPLKIQINQIDQVSCMLEKTSIGMDRDNESIRLKILEVHSKNLSFGTQETGIPNLMGNNDEVGRKSSQNVTSQNSY